MSKPHSVYRQALYLSSAATLKQLPPDDGIEVAFAGRSNVGKSSLLNALTDQKKLAKTSQTPGRTQTLNFFQLDSERRLVDLPGYGYAKAALVARANWGKTTLRYLAKRQCLEGLCILLDARHEPMSLDQEFIQSIVTLNLPIYLILTKSDKLTRGAAQMSLNRHTQHWTSAMGPDKTTLITGIQLFSSKTLQGLDELNKALDAWYGFKLVAS